MPGCRRRRDSATRSSSAIADPEAKAKRIAWRSGEHSCSDVKWVWIRRVNIALRIRFRRMRNTEFVSIGKPEARVAVIGYYWSSINCRA